MELIPFNTGWKFHLGELALPPRRLVAKASMSGGFSDLCTDEFTTTTTTTNEDDNYSDISTNTTTATTARELQDKLADLVIAEPEQGQFWAEPTPATLLPKKSWVDVQLPHDFKAEHAPNRAFAHRPDYPFAMQGSGLLGIAYYRKLWSQPAAMREGERVYVRLDGVMRHSDVWVNGFWLGGARSGYDMKRYDVTEILREVSEMNGAKDRNVVLVRCENTEAEGWWNEGGGIYRDVWLEVMSEVCVMPEGCNIVVESVDADVAHMTVFMEVSNASETDQMVTIETQIRDPDGELVCEYSSTIWVTSTGTATSVEKIIIAKPKLWTVNKGILYELLATISHPSTPKSCGPVREFRSTFGIRTISFSPIGQFLLNGQPIFLRGANIHQDFGGLGSALPPSIITYKLALLQQMGCNLVRVSHHPPSQHLLAAASRLGMLIIVENRLLSTSGPSITSLTQLIRTTRAYPCVIIYSLGNEEALLENTRSGTLILRRLHSIIRSLDPARHPTIIASAIPAYDTTSPFHNVTDIVGCHYATMMNATPLLRKAWPRGKPILLDEEGLFPSARSTYADNVVLAHPSVFGSSLGWMAGLNAMFKHFYAMGGGKEEDFVEYDFASVWDAVLRSEVAGAVVWAGMDYSGEACPNTWPGVGSSFGAMDFVGVPKDYYWAVRAAFAVVRRREEGEGERLVHLVPSHWTWPGKEGEEMRVWVVSNCEKVVVEVNGKQVAEAQVDGLRAKFENGEIVYQPGRMLAKGLDGCGRIVASHELNTANTPKRVKICALPRKRIACGGCDCVCVRMRIEDAAGELCPWASNLCHVTLDGPGKMVGMGNGDPSSLDSQKTPFRRAFAGYVAAMVRSDGNALGKIVLKVSSDGLTGDEVLIGVVSPGEEDDHASAASELMTSGRHEISVL